jgi:hypothetical protein
MSQGTHRALTPVRAGSLAPVRAGEKTGIIILIELSSRKVLDYYYLGDFDKSLSTSDLGDFDNILPQCSIKFVGLILKKKFVGLSPTMSHQPIE